MELDGKVLGGGRYEVSTDGTTLTVTTEGMGVKGPFKTRAVFERVSPDPYLPQAWPEVSPGDCSYALAILTGKPL